MIILIYFLYLHSSIQITFNNFIFPCILSPSIVIDFEPLPSENFCASLPACSFKSFSSATTTRKWLFYIFTFIILYIFILIFLISVKNLIIFFILESFAVFQGYKHSIINKVLTDLIILAWSYLNFIFLPFYFLPVFKCESLLHFDFMVFKFVCKTKFSGHKNYVSVENWCFVYFIFCFCFSLLLKILYLLQVGVASISSFIFLVIFAVLTKLWYSVS